LFTSAEPSSSASASRIGTRNASSGVRRPRRSLPSAVRFPLFLTCRRKASLPFLLDSLDPRPEAGDPSSVLHDLLCLLVVPLWKAAAPSAVPPSRRPLQKYIPIWLPSSILPVPSLPRPHHERLHRPQPARWGRRDRGSAGLGAGRREARRSGKPDVPLLIDTTSPPLPPPRPDRGRPCPERVRFRGPRRRLASR
jgi:hypothetical protein